MVRPPRRFSSKVAISVVALMMGSGAALWAARSKSQEPVDRSPLNFQPNAGQRRKLDALRSTISPERPRFSPAEARERSNAKLFTYLAATSDETPVLLAALDAIGSAYASRSSRKETPDADLEKVLLKHLRSARDDVASAAFAAARVPLMMATPPDGLTRGLAELAAAGQSPRRRYATLEALDSIRPDRRALHVIETFEQALGAAEARFPSRALLALAQSGPSVASLSEPHRQRIGRRVLDLLGHADAGVRGRSLAVLAEVDALAPAARWESARAALKDAHPYVRGQAADLLGRAARPAAVHLLIDLVADVAPARYEISGFTEIDDTPGTLEHTVAGRPRVADVAQLAIVTLSSTLEGVSAPVLAPRARGEPEASLLANAEALRAWYHANAERLPRD